MSNYDDRLAALERKVANIELRRLRDESLAQENTPSEQGRNLRELNENITILLGITMKQHEITSILVNNFQSFKESTDQQFADIKQDIGELYVRFDRLDRRFTSQESKLGNLEQQFIALDNKTDQRFTALEEKFEQRFASQESKFDSLEHRFTSLEGKFDLMLQMVTALTKTLRE